MPSWSGYAIPYRRKEKARMFTSAELAAPFGIGADVVRRLGRQGKVPCKVVASRYYFPRAAVLAMVRCGYHLRLSE